jgi:hypothetical protein
MSVESLVEALEGRFDRWWWSAGLTPEVVGAALKAELTTGRAQLRGHPLQQTVVTTAAQPYPVRFRWELDGELALVELSAPTATPSWPFVIEALGEPDVILEHGRGPVPGGDQRCHFERGLTVFDGAGLGYQAVWLYPPMPADEYPERTGAFEPIQRMR